MAGAAVYQLAPDDSSQDVKAIALKPGAEQTVALLANEANKPATKPCM